MATPETKGQWWTVVLTL